MTGVLPPALPLYLAATPDTVFGMFHPPADESSAGVAVLICPPWGWDEIASYRARRTWAEHLAGAGHPTLRIDLPASGDSAGDPGDPDRLPSWTAAVVTATTWLAGSTPSGRVAVIGLGLGGLIAGQALAAGAPISELVLWAASTQGRAFLREQRAFGMLQSARYGSTDGAGEVLPDGWLEIGGFVLSAETIAAIETLDLRQTDPAMLQRVLLLSRDGLPVDAGLQQRLEQAGVAVTVGPGHGWGAMCFHPERYQPPFEVFDRVAGWLAAGDTATEDTAAGNMAQVAASTLVRPGLPVLGAASAEADLVVDGIPIHETAFGHDDPSGGFFGILAEPVGPGGDLCAVFLNAGAVRRIGPNRMWVEASRRWAARGIPTVRVDVEGIGDANGDAAMYFDVGCFYTTNRARQVSAIIDALEARGLGPRFALIGLCAGAYSAFTAGTVDRRVVEALSVNPRILIWDPALLVRRDAYLVNRVLNMSSWQRILRGETSAGTVLAIGRSAVLEAARAAARGVGRLRGRRHVDPWTGELDGMLDLLRDKDTRLVLAFADDEPINDELETDGVLARLDRWPNVEIVGLPGADHTLRPITAQRAFHRIVDRELDQLTAAD